MRIRCTYKLYVSFAQEQPPTHFAPIRKKTEDVRPQKHTQTHLVNYNTTQFSSNVYLIRWWCCIDPATLTVEVSLSRAFIWRISLQMSLLPSESSSDLGERETPLLVTNWQKFLFKVLTTLPPGLIRKNYSQIQIGSIRLNSSDVGTSPLSYLIN